jgi:DNA-binding response OmpR family regulator
MTTLDLDAMGSLDGHPSQDEGAHQVWLGAALEVAGAADLDLLISGLGLPDGSGLELMSRSRARHAVTGIAPSGFGRDEDIRRSREAGFAGHLTKPVDLRRLEAMIRQVAS